MVEVGGSNPPGPTKRQTLASGGVFLFGAALAADFPPYSKQDRA